MSGNCDDCGWHTLECICSAGCPCRQSDYFTHLNAVPRDDPDPIRHVKWINIRGRSEHESVIINRDLCTELGLDQAYEIMIYLRRWGNFLSE